MPRALIAGAGIGGLTAALALGRAGFDVTIFERASALEAFGAGVQLSPNSTRVLDRLGVLGEIAKLATSPRAIRVLRGRDDAELMDLGLLDAEARWGAPYLVIHRADLQGALVRAVGRWPQVELRLGHEVVGFTSGAGSVTIDVKRGSLAIREAGDVLVGADGLRSKVRDRFGLGSEDAARFSGRVAFRANVPSAALGDDARKPEVTLRLGARAHLVQYPLRDASLVNLVAVIESDWRGAAGEHPWDGLADLPALKRAFADWSGAARALIEAPPIWRAWPIWVRDPIHAYASGRVALLGDAAHPMAPFLAQGAAQSIEDAGILAARLSESGDVAAALASYSRDRAPRAGRVQREALAQARLYHLSGPFALARDLGMRALGAERLHARYDWLYGA